MIGTHTKDIRSGWKMPNIPRYRYKKTKEPCFTDAWLNARLACLLKKYPKIKDRKIQKIYVYCHSYIILKFKKNIFNKIKNIIFSLNYDKNISKS